MSPTLSLLPRANTNITSVELPSRTISLRFCPSNYHHRHEPRRSGLPNLVDGGSAGRRHCQPSLWPRPTPINCTNGKSTVRSSQPKMMYRRFRGTYTRDSASAGGDPAWPPSLKDRVCVYAWIYKRGLVVTESANEYAILLLVTLRVTYYPLSEAFECHIEAYEESVRQLVI